MTVLETLAYALSRGFWRAYFDVLKERDTAVEEQPNDQDRVRADRFRNAVRLQSPPKADRDPQPGDPAPGG